MTPADWHWAGISSGFGICGGAALLSLWVALKLLRLGPVGPLAAMVAGLVIRTLLGLGGSAIVFTVINGWSAESGDKVTYWLWVLASYLIGLIVELVWLVRRLPKLAPPGKG